MLIQEKLSAELRADILAYLAAHYDELVLQRCGQDTLSLDDGEYQKNAMPMMVSKTMSLKEMLKELDAGFSETLMQLIDQSGKKDAEIYKRAGLTKQHFSKIRSNANYRPTKPTALALAIALELNLEQTMDLLSRAGYTLSNSSKFDLIVRYFIEQGRYDLMEINLALYEFDQPLLGSC